MVTRERQHEYDVRYRATHRLEINRRERLYYRLHKTERAAQKQKYYRTHKEMYRARQIEYRGRQLESKYGITLADYNALMQHQGLTCAICRTQKWASRGNTPHVDHDHATGRVRGILCSNCNAALGMINDDPAIAREMAHYLDIANLARGDGK